MKTILIVDDNPMVLQTLQGILSEEGYNVVVAGGPDEAMQYCRETKFDLALCDLRMPSSGSGDSSVNVGMTTICEISSTFPDVPVIAISGELAPEHLPKMEKFGAVDAIAKPFCVEELLGKVADSMRK